jgi:hypothetical protein
MDAFEPAKGPDDATGIRFWRRSIVVGSPDAVEKMCAPPPKAEPIVRPVAKP